MHIKTSLKYYFFSLLILFTVFNTVVAEPNTATVNSAEPSAISLQTKQYSADAASNKDNVISSGFCLTDIFLNNQQVVQTGGSLVGKRIQVDKDLLLLHATRYSNAVKASNSNHIKYSDSLTHIFLFLFPYHFFW